MTPAEITFAACALLLGIFIGGLIVGVIMGRPSHTPGRHRAVTVYSPSGRGHL